MVYIIIGTSIEFICTVFRLTERLKNDKLVCCAFLIAVCVRIFLEKREAMLDHFTSEFQQLTLADEKNDLLDSFLQSLTVEMDRDPLWQGIAIKCPLS